MAGLHSGTWEGGGTGRVLSSQPQHLAPGGALTLSPDAPALTQPDLESPKRGAQLLPSQPQASLTQPKCFTPYQSTCSLWRLLPAATRSRTCWLPEHRPCPRAGDCTVPCRGPESLLVCFYFYFNEPIELKNVFK